MRFRLLSPHYLHCPGNTWEQKETDRDTGRQARKVYDVPRYLHPDDPGDCNYPGEVIISTKTSVEHRRDIIVTGPKLKDGSIGEFLPTPDMEPLDAEAEAAMAKLRPVWDGAHIESSGGSLSDSLVQAFEAKMTELLKRNGGTAHTPDPTVAELLKQVQDLTAQVALLTTPQPVSKRSL